MNMNQVMVNFRNPEEVAEFTNTVSGYPYHMDIVKSSTKVADAKSMMGIIAMGLQMDLLLKVYGDDCKDMMQKIQKFVRA